MSVLVESLKSQGKYMQYTKIKLTFWTLKGAGLNQVVSGFLLLKTWPLHSNVASSQELSWTFHLSGF